MVGPFSCKQQRPRLALHDRPRTCFFQFTWLCGQFYGACFAEREAEIPRVHSKKVSRQTKSNVESGPHKIQCKGFNSKNYLTRTARGLMVLLKQITYVTHTFCPVVSLIFLLGLSIIAAQQLSAHVTHAHLVVPMPLIFQRQPITTFHMRKMNSKLRLNDPKLS